MVGASTGIFSGRVPSILRKLDSGSQNHGGAWYEGNVLGKSIEKPVIFSRGLGASQAYAAHCHRFIIESRMIRREILETLEILKILKILEILAPARGVFGDRYIGCLF